MTVAGAARSGLAAAELLARRGARVTLSDSRAELPEADRLRAPRRRARAGWSYAGDVHVGRPRRAQPGRAAGTGRGAGGARSRHSGDRGDRARVALAAGPRDRDHRHQGQVDDDGADRADARGGGIQGDRRRQHRLAAERAGLRVDAGHVPRRRDEQLSARADRHVPSVDRGDAEFFAGPPRSPSRRRGVRGGEGADLREPGRRRLRGDQRRRSGGPRAGAPRPGERAVVFARAARSIAARWSRTAGLSIAGRTSRSGWCRSTRSICWARTW